MRTPSVRWLLVSLTLALSCKDNGPDGIGDPAQIVVVAGTPQSALAGTELATPVTISVRDADGDGVPGLEVTFTITGGGGRFDDGTTEATATTDANGNATAPGWVVGKSVVPQVMRVASAGIVKDDITTTVQTAYNIVIRFFGPAMSAQNQALFTTAAARISAMITEEVIAADARNSGIDLSKPRNEGGCDINGAGMLNEIIDDIVIYASVSNIDGQGNVLAQGGACLLRGAPNDLPALGVMEFDSADLPGLAAAGRLQDVITHEMLHVLGFGTIWEAPYNDLLTNPGTADPRYVGTGAIQGCQQAGGSIACASSVPVENTGGDGTADAHWREAKFDTELMTGFLDSGTNPISAMTIGALADLGYGVNLSAADDYTIASNTALRALMATGLPPGWERVIRPVATISNGRVTMLRSK